MQAARALSVISVALTFGGCCTLPEGPKTTETGPHPIYYAQWTDYEICRAYFEALAFGILASAVNFGYGQEPRDAAPAGSSPPLQGAPPDPLPR